LTITVATPARSLDVAFFTTRDPRMRALPVRRFLMPFAKPAPPDDLSRGIPEIAGGNWEAGHALFTGKALCATCHQLRGEGVKVGPDLGKRHSFRLHESAAQHRGPECLHQSRCRRVSALPARTARPWSSTRVGETADELQNRPAWRRRDQVEESRHPENRAPPVSLMPTGIDKSLTASELRDLMTYLLTEPAKTRP